MPYAPKYAFMKVHLLIIPSDPRHPFFVHPSRVLPRPVVHLIVNVQRARIRYLSDERAAWHDHLQTTYLFI
jgi:hypothetical protein